jgi:peptidoglycan hydrolase-like protein with peptidoglycan-binding domain
MEDKDRRPDKMPISLPLTRHMRGLEIEKMQMWLNDLNDYYQFNKKDKAIKESGYYSDQTIRMIKEFQKFCNLPPSGMYEAKTHEMVEWKFMNMNVTIVKIAERARIEAIMGGRKW